MQSGWDASVNQPQWQSCAITVQSLARSKGCHNGRSGNNTSQWTSQQSAVCIILIMRWRAEVYCSAMIARVVTTISTTKRMFKKFTRCSNFLQMCFFYRKKSDIRLANQPIRTMCACKIQWQNRRRYSTSIVFFGITRSKKCLSSAKSTDLSHFWRMITMFFLFQGTPH